MRPGVRALADGAMFFVFVLLIMAIVASGLFVGAGLLGVFMVATGMSPVPFWGPLAMIFGGLGFGMLSGAALVKAYES